MTVYTSTSLTEDQTKSRIEDMHRPQVLHLPTLLEADGASAEGIAVTGYGKGRVSGVMYTVPAHGEIDVDFTVKMHCVTPEDVQKLTDLVKASLDATRREMFREYERTHVSGGASFFGFFGWGGARASYTKVKERMNSMGMSEENQRKVIGAMMDAATEMTTFNYQGTIYNRHNSYSVSGNLFGIVMDAEVSYEQATRQVRMIAPRPHMQTSGGEVLPVVGDLYALDNG